MTDWCARWDAGETPWDRGSASPPLEEYLSQPEAANLKGARILVPGCGSGHDVRVLAAFGAQVTGLDLSEKAVEVAQNYPAKAEERYLQGDLFEWQDELYDAFWEHTCFCAIEPFQRPRYAASAARLIRPGGLLIGVFYLTPGSPGETHVPPPHGADRDEIVGCFSPDFELQWEKVPEKAYPGREGKEWLAVFKRLS